MPLFNSPPPLWGYRTNYWYHPPGISGTALLSSNQLTYAPMLIAVSHTFVGIGIEFTVAGTTNSVTRLGIYADSGGLPGKLILDAGTLPSSCVAAVQTIPITQNLPPGVVWVASAGQGTPGTQPTTRRLALENPILGVSTVLSQFGSGYFETAVSTALPATATPGIETGSAPAVMLQA